MQFGIKLLDCADSLLGKRVNKKSSILDGGIQGNSVVNMKRLKSRVILKCLEDLDEPSIVSTSDIIDMLDLLERHGLP